MSMWPARSRWMVEARQLGVTAAVASTILAAVIGGVGVAASLGTDSPLFLVGLAPAAALITLAIFGVPFEWLLGVLLIVAFTSRGGISIGFPAALSFAHAGILVLVLLRVAIQRPLAVSWPLIPVGAVMVSIAVALSAALNGWYGLMPIILFVTLVEPFLVLWLLLSMPLQETRQIAMVAALLAVGQIPIAVSQWVAVGPADAVQGTFGASGAHPLGGVALAWAIPLLLSRRRALMFTVPVLLLLPFVADAKQMVLLAAVGLALGAVIGVARRRLEINLALGVRRVAIGLGMAMLVALAAPSLVPAYEQFTDWSRLTDYGDNKVVAAETVQSQLGPRWFGFGPGQGLSRTSLSTLPGYGNLPSFVKGDARSALAASALPYAGPGLVSSAASPWASWIGVYADVGVAGTTVYALLGLSALLAVYRAGGAHADSAAGILIFWLLTGVAFTWIEEPSFSIAVMAAVAATSRELLASTDSSTGPRPAAVGTAASQRLRPHD